MLSSKTGPWKVRVRFEALAMTAPNGPNPKMSYANHGLNHVMDSRRISTFWRLILLIPALVGFCIWWTAFSLVPNPNRVGTHTQLGLAECPMMARTGGACPTCGMTTAAAWLARGHLQDSLRSNPAGLPLFGLAITTAGWLGLCSFKGRIVGFENWDRPLALCSGGLFSIALTCWLIRLSQAAQQATVAGP